MRKGKVLMDQHNSPNRIWPRLWKPALAGIAGGALFVIANSFIGYEALIYNIWQIVWNEYSNTDLSALISLQYDAILVLSILLSALLAVTFTYKYIKKPTNALMPGAVAGMAFVPAIFFYTILSLITVDPLFGSKDPSSGSLLEIPPILYYILIAIYMAVSTPIAMAVTAAVAAIYAFLIQKLAGGEKKIKSANRVMIALILSMIALMVIAPPAIAYAGLSMGWIKGTPNGYYECISINRLDENSIAINYTGSPNLRFDPDTPFTIEIYGADGQSRNATNAEAIRQSGIPATISPDYGLQSNKGASVVLSGDGIKKPTSIDITVHPANGDKISGLWNLIV